MLLFKAVGRGKLSIINYSGGTEISGGIVMGNVLTPMKPCAFSGPLPGMAADVVDENGKSVRGKVGELVIHEPWIGMTRGIPIYGSRITSSPTRSEEHTSELQSREKLVCCLLLAKNKCS